MLFSICGRAHFPYETILTTQRTPITKVRGLFLVLVALGLDLLLYNIQSSLALFFLDVPILLLPRWLS